MKNIITIFSKEFKEYFNSPVAYIVIIVFLLVSGWFFQATMFLVNQATIGSFLGNVPLLFVFFIPAITMRLFSEEMKSGTMEILTTLPLEDYQIILGKYLAALGLVTVAIGLTLIHPFILMFLGKLDYGEIIGSYLGLFLMGAAFVAIGVFASSITKNQIISFIVAFIVCFVFFMFNKILSLVPSYLVSLFE
ncbi:ABC transporter permease subunit, partial [bacterium]|nr:ABC transporter permease subunit [bacterium]